MAKKPTLDELIAIVQQHDKRIAMRMIYNRYFIPFKDRPKYRKLYDAIAKELKNGSDSNDNTGNAGQGPDSE